MANDFFNDLGAALSKTAQDLGGRMGAMYEAGKTRGRISGEEQAKNKLLYDLGNITYQHFLRGESSDEEIVQICRRIRQHDDRIERLRREAEQMNARRFCPMCGRQADPGALFCANCGTSLTKDAPMQNIPNPNMSMQDMVQPESFEPETEVDLDDIFEPEQDLDPAEAIENETEADPAEAIEDETEADLMEAMEEDSSIEVE